MDPEQELQDMLGLRKKRRGTWALDRAKEEFLRRHLRSETPIQSQAIDPIYEGRDAVLISATASGKTEAVMIPVAARIMAGHKRELAIYLGPTRALLNDMYRRLQPSLSRLNLAARIRHGDRPLASDASEVDVLFTTPESLDVLLVQGATMLERTAWVIADEIHELFTTPRGSQLQFLVQRLGQITGRRIQCIALSATVGDPDGLAAWLCPGRQAADVFVAPGQRTVLPVIRWSSTVQDLGGLLRTRGASKILVFVNSRRTADDVFLALQTSVAPRLFVHYSSLERSHREYVEAQFREIDMGVCVATPTLELGIDIGSVEEVVLYDAPTSAGSFLQRVGRGGRRGDANYAVMTPSSDLELLQFLALSHLANAGQLERDAPGEPFSVLVQQVFSHTCAKHHHRIHDTEILQFCAPLHWVGAEDVRELLKSLVSRHYLRYDSKWDNYLMGRGLEEEYDDARMYSNIEGRGGGFALYSSGHRLGTVPLASSRVSLGSVILYAGAYWRVMSISGARLKVVAADPVPDPVRPLWTSRGLFSTSLTLAHGMREVLVSRPEMSAYDLDASSRERTQGLFERVPARARPETVWHEQQPGCHIYYTFAGTIANLALRLLFRSVGYDCELAPHATGTAIISSGPLNLSAITKEKHVLEALFRQHWEEFSGLTQVGPYANLVPLPLRRRETMSQVMTDDVLRELVTLRDRPVVDARLGLVTQ